MLVGFDWYDDVGALYCCGNTGGFCELLGVSMGVGGMGDGIMGMAPEYFDCSSFPSVFAIALAAAAESVKA